MFQFRANKNPKDNTVSLAYNLSLYWLKTLLLLGTRRAVGRGAAHNPAEFEYRSDFSFTIAFTKTCFMEIISVGQKVLP